MKLRSVLFIIFLTINTIYTADHKTLTVLAIPGQNGLGYNNIERHNDCHINTLYNNNTRIQNIPTPTFATDFGQYFCQRHLHQALESINTPCGIEASSQGAATALNYFSKNLNNTKIKALVLQSAMASGNSAIYHTVSQYVPCISSLPGAYYILPYIARLWLPFLTYSPSGEQPVDSVKNIRKSEIPIILVHATQDFQVSPQDSQALYYALKENKNKHVYLVPIDVQHHLHLLDYPDSTEDGKKRHEAQKCVRNILEYHRIIPTGRLERATSSRIKTCQPDHKQYQSQYENLLKRESVHQKITTRIIGNSAVLMILYYALLHNLIAYHYKIPIL